MKKTDKTALTAAMFAAALNVAALTGGNTASADESIAEAPVTAAAPVTEFMTTMCPVYGTMPVSETTALTDVTTDHEFAVPSGDLNGDGRTDAFDMVILRRQVLSPTDTNRADVNNDGKINVADLVTMNRFLMGQTSSLNDSEVKDNKLETSTTSVTEETTTTVTDVIPAPVYGPPSWFGLEDE